MKLVSLTIVIFCLFAIAYISQAQSGIMIDTRDGKLYKTIQIGSQTWMAENLCYASPGITKNAYGGLETLSRINTGIYCYRDDTINIPNYGLLYSWDAAMKSCPVGWHLPQKLDYDSLLTHAGSDGKIAYQNLIMGGSTGFDAIFAGCFSNMPHDYAYFQNRNRLDFYWTSTCYKPNKYYYLYISSYTKQCSMEATSIYLNNKPSTPYFCFPVRCIKD